MSTGFFNVPVATNEPIYSYAPGTPEREELQNMIAELSAKTIDAPMIIDGKEVRTDDRAPMTSPQNHQHVLGHYHRGNASHAKRAIESALMARDRWASMPWEQRAAIFLKMADLVSGPYRSKINAATMLGQGKNAFQSEIDAVCEFADFLRYNVEYATQIYSDQPESSDQIWNRLEYRPLEGFVYAITPFNFTAIAGNLPTSAAMMGNVVVWKPSDSQVYSAQVLIEIFKEAGLPDGVINVIYGDPVEITSAVLSSPDFAGLHFTGSTTVFQNLWKSIGERIHTYKTYPRIVGETGGKDFVLAHPSANARQVAVGMVRGAFEYQGQKCSAASRAYVPESMWPDVERHMREMLDEMTMGDPAEFQHFINAVIHEGAFDKLQGFIDRARTDADAEVIMGGNCDKSKGYFIEPTVIKTTNPQYVTMREELFGPVLTVYVYRDEDWSEVLNLVDETSVYALTGAVFSTDRYAATEATQRLVNAAGNFYINDKPTGAVVGQQPFGGARASGTNDKAGSALNLLRWVSPRTIKENFVPPVDYRYPFMG